MGALTLNVEDLPDIPRAPSREAWNVMSPEERARVVEALPAAMTEAELLPPEGDPHLEAKVEAKETLRSFFAKRGRSVYVGADLTVYYPDEQRFAPDVLVVLDVPAHPRMKWVVSAEGKGLDLVIEVHVAGDRKKDLERNVARYARLGIPEYFVYDRGRQRLTGWRLADAAARAYQPVVPQAGRFGSRVLELDLAIEEGRLRFYSGTAELLAPADVIVKLERFAEEAAQRAEHEAHRADEEARRADEEARRAEAAERRAADLESALEELRRRKE